VGFTGDGTVHGGDAEAIVFYDKSVEEVRRYFDRDLGGVRVE